MPKLSQKGVIHFLALFILAIGVITTVYLATHPTFFKPKASSGDNLQIVKDDGSEFPNNTTDNPSVRLKINLPDGWVVNASSQSFNFDLVKPVFAQESCNSDCGSCTTVNTCGYATYDTCIDDKGQTGDNLCGNGATKFGCQASDNSNCQSGNLEYSCANSPQCSDKAVINARLNDLKVSIESDCKSDCAKCETVTSCGYTTYDTCKDDQGYSGSDLCKHGATKFGCQAQDNNNCQSGDLEYNCSNNPQCNKTGDIQPQIKQNDQHIIQKVIIENKDTDGSSGGSEKKEIPPDQLNTLIPWELKHLQTNQSQAQRYVQVTLFDGKEYKALPANITLTKPSGKGNGIQARISPGLEIERIDSMRSTFKISTDLPDNMVEQAVKDDLYKSNIVVDGDITNGDAVVSVLSDCINNQQTNYLFSEYDAFPPLCLTDEQKQRAVEYIRAGVESAADFVIPYSQAKQAVELASEVQNVRSFLKKAGIADRNQLSVISGPDSDFDGYAVTLIRIKELEKDVQENPDGSGKLTPAQEEARREYLADLRTLWEKQHNILVELSGAAALSVIDRPLKVVANFARPVTAPLVAKLGGTKNAIFNFLNNSWGKLTGLPDLKGLPEIIQNRVKETFASLREAYPGIKSEIFSTKGSSGVIYRDLRQPDILYKIYASGEDLGNDPVATWINNVRYAALEARKLKLLSQEGISPGLIEYVPPRLTEEEKTLLNNQSFGRWVQQTIDLSRVSLQESNRVADLPIVVMERVDIDPKGLTKLNSDIIRKKAEIDRVVSVLEKEDLYPSDTELVVDSATEKLTFIDVGGIMPHSTGTFAEDSIREAVEYFFNRGLAGE